MTRLSPRGHRYILRREHGICARSTPCLLHALVPPPCCSERSRKHAPRLGEHAACGARRVLRAALETRAPPRRATHGLPPRLGGRCRDATRCAAEPTAGASDGSRRRGDGGGARTGEAGVTALARQDFGAGRLEQDARHWAFLNSVGLQPEVVHSLLQRRSGSASEAAAGGVTAGDDARLDDALLAPSSLAELVEVVEYLLQSGYGRNKDIITGLRTFFTHNATARYLASLGVRDVGRTLVRFPQLLRYDVAEVLAPRVAYLRDELGITDVGLAITRHPPLLLYRPDTKLAPVADYLRRELGVRDVGRLLTRCPSLLSASLEAKLQPTVAFLMQQGLQPADFDRILVKHPALFTHSLNDKIVPVVDFLSDLGVKDVARVLRLMPTLLACSLEHKLQPAAEYLRELGVADVGRFVQSYPAALAYSLTRKLPRTVAWLRAAGVTDVGVLLAAMPALSGYSVTANLEPKRRLLVHVMGRPVEDAVRFPAFWAYSLRRRILPRYAFLLEHGVADSVSLASMLAGSDERFVLLPALRAAGAPADFSAHCATPAFAARVAALERAGKLWGDSKPGRAPRELDA